MKRKIEEQLLAWKNRPERLPLLVLGARQVGKTYSAEAFGARYFNDVVSVNFQTDLSRLIRLFEADLDPKRIISDLGYLYDRRIDPENTLLIFDEIQLCQPALTSLKYFAERAGEYTVIATGSLFGITVHRDARYSFPVGKVEILDLHPLDFEEYLWACGKELWAEGIRKSYRLNMPFAAHREALALYREYLVVGGLPAAVDSWLTTRDHARVRDIQRSLATLYAADMGIYLDDANAVRTRAVWDSAPRQLAREKNRKFKLAEMKGGARLHHYQAPFAWLQSAGIVHLHYQAAAEFPPLEPRDGGTFFKVFLHDVGLLGAQMDIKPEIFLNEQGYQQLASGFRGGITENYVKQALEANNLKSYYWASGNTAEVDFLFQDELMQVIPIEVKAGDNVRSKSLQLYRQRHQSAYALRLSSKEFGLEDGLKSVPLYAAFCIE
ncbi:MAG: ATP-binding protein [Coriobacteriales bacterium]|jgi:predicted AAA+ superfamily ATPase|nr:ATP-binding protein [Coriobacteriales bacterium]